MAIPETQLETWANQGATVSAQRSHEAVRTAIQNGQFSRGRPDVYLQGSYANSTNIRGDSDVDVVVQCDAVNYEDDVWLDDQQKRAMAQAYSPSSYGFGNFRAEVIRALEQHFGERDVLPADKCVKIRPNQNRIPIDVVPAILLKRYRTYPTRSSDDWVPGMQFYRQDTNEKVVNFPKAHLRNGEAKNADRRTGGYYKHAVRIFKNMRRHLVEDGQLSKDIAPSYFIVCLIYNVPDNCFGTSYNRTIFEALNFLSGQFGQFVCQNEQTYLFGGTGQQWSVAHARQSVNAVTTLWNDW